MYFTSCLKQQLLIQTFVWMLAFLLLFLLVHVLLSLNNSSSSVPASSSEVKVFEDWIRQRSEFRLFL